MHSALFKDLEEKRPEGSNKYNLCIPRIVQNAIRFIKKNEEKSCCSYVVFMVQPCTIYGRAGIEKN